MKQRERPDPPPWPLPLAWAVSLSLLFMLLYVGTNWYTSTRTDVGVVRFAWEDRIPLIAAFLLPYASIDLLFFLAPFVCATRRELSTHGQRILAVTIIAPLCFLLFPLRLPVARSEMTGIAGSLYELLKTFDQPYNMCPSLHVAYAIILWLLYARLTRNWLRGMVHVWFALVVMSVLFVHQHHVIDVIGGGVLAVAVVYIIPSAARLLALPRRGAVCPNRRIASCYGTGATGCIAAASLTAPVGFLLLWPGVALAIVCAAYLGIGPRIFRKTDGAVSPEARIMLTPYLAGLWLSRVYYRWRERRQPAGSEIVPGLIVGRQCTRREASAITNNGLAAVLDLTTEHSETPAFRRLAYRNVQTLDLTRPIPEQLHQAVRAVRELMNEGALYIHCGLGYSRSALIAAAVLLDLEMAASVEDACRMVTQARPKVIFTHETAQLLAPFANRPIAARGGSRLRGTRTSEFRPWACPGDVAVRRYPKSERLLRPGCRSGRRASRAVARPTLRTLFRPDARAIRPERIHRLVAPEDARLALVIHHTRAHLPIVHVHHLVPQVHAGGDELKR